MNVFAYCAKTFERSARRAAGVEPHCSPPLDADTFQVKWLEGRHLIYFDLHGEPGQPFWWGETIDSIGLQHKTLALRADQIRAADIGGAVVFATNCYLGDRDSPMLDALLDAGAAYVIGGDGANWAGKDNPFGASLLGKWFRKYLIETYDPVKALAWAKVRLKLTLYRDELLNQRASIKAARDTLSFKAYYRRSSV